jgi:hypothetical protein
MKWLIAAGCLASALACSAGSPAAAQPNYPFVGSWGGGITDCKDPFRFTQKTYTPPGADTMTIRKVERDGSMYQLTFDDDYSISVEVKGSRMEWFSAASGDAFTLRRCR